MQSGQLVVVVDRLDSLYRFIGEVIFANAARQTNRVWPLGEYGDSVSGMFIGSPTLIEIGVIFTNIPQVSRIFISKQLRPANEHEQFLYYINGSQALIGENDELA